MVQLVAADPGQVVALGVEEQVLEVLQRRVVRRRVTAAQAPVDLDDGLLGGLDLVDEQRVAQEGADEQVVDEQDVQSLVDAVGQERCRCPPR